MEEFFEVLSWAQLGVHNKPCGLLNVCDYYQHLVRFLDYAVEQDFLRPKHRALLIVEAESGRLLDRFEQFIATHTDPRVRPGQDLGFNLASASRVGVSRISCICCPGDGNQSTLFSYHRTFPAS